MHTSSLVYPITLHATVGAEPATTVTHALKGYGALLRVMLVVQPEPDTSLVPTAGGVTGG